MGCSCRTLVPQFASCSLPCRRIVYACRSNPPLFLLVCDVHCWWQCQYFGTARVLDFPFPLVVSLYLYLDAVRRLLTDYRVGPHPLCQACRSVHVKLTWERYLLMWLFYVSVLRCVLLTCLRCKHRKGCLVFSWFPSSLSNIVVRIIWGGSPQARDLLPNIWSILPLAWTAVSGSDEILDKGEVTLLLCRDLHY